MTALKQIISSQIKRFGPMTVADYMTLCLLHPKHGYYRQKNPLGAAGDFTTAPEISQMFGELLGLCLAQVWRDQGSIKQFSLVELGPGNGTLMADILRVGATVPGFVDAAQVWLVEVNPALRQKQETALCDYSPNWVEQINDLPELPLYLVANEFFDALPIRQFTRCREGWQEQMIGLVNEALAFGPATPIPVEAAEHEHRHAGIGDVVETNPGAAAMVAEISGLIARLGGVALITDYGHWDATGDSFQAVRNHQKTDPLAEPGQADLTAHVNFAALARATQGAVVTKMTKQGVFLQRLGIAARARVLAENLTGAALDCHVLAHRRLTHPDEMGSLFKAIAIHPENAPVPPGFDP